MSTEQDPAQAELAWRRSRPRPGPPKTGWILVVTTVAVVIFIGITIWSVGTWGLGGVSRPSDTEVVHGLVVDWQERYAQAPGPPSRYRAEADAALREGRWKVAHERLTMALALDPDDLDALYQLVILSGRHPEGEFLDAATQDGLLEVLHDTAGEHRLLPAAAAWVLLSREDPMGALASAGESPKTLAARQARLRALGVLSQPALEAAEAVLEFDPGDREACTIAGRELLASGRPWRVGPLLERCSSSAREGADPVPSWARTRADALDRLGRPLDAVALLEAAGLWVHAAQIRAQEGLELAPELLVELAEQPDPHRAVAELQVGLLTDRPDLVDGALERLAQMPQQVAEVRLVQAAALVERDQCAVAGDLLDGIDGAEGRALRARCAWARGDEEDALQELSAALADQPWRAPLHAQHLSWAEAHGEQALAAATRTLVAVDPLLVASYDGHRDRDVPWALVLPSADVPLASPLQAALDAVFVEEATWSLESAEPPEWDGEGAAATLLAAWNDPDSLSETDGPLLEHPGWSIVQAHHALGAARSADALDNLAAGVAADGRRWGLARMGAGLVSD